jgi:CheY-like chemotaxis protein
VVEDEAVIRMMIVGLVEELGHRVVAEAGTMQDAKVLVETAAFDLALLDVSIAGQSVAPIAEILMRRCLPFLLVSGYEERSLPEPLRKALILRKPFAISKLKETIETTLAG